jgi:hypothetical protein
MPEGSFVSVFVPGRCSNLIFKSKPKITMTTKAYARTKTKSAKAPPPPMKYFYV